MLLCPTMSSTALLVSTLYRSDTEMRVTTILAIVAIVAALGAITSLIPVQQVSAQSQADPDPNEHAFNSGTSTAHSQTPGNLPPFCHLGFRC